MVFLRNKSYSPGPVPLQIAGTSGVHSNNEFLECCWILSFLNCSLHSCCISCMRISFILKFIIPVHSYWSWLELHLSMHFFGSVHGLFIYSLWCIVHKIYRLIGIATRAYQCIVIYTLHIWVPVTKWNTTDMGSSLEIKKRIVVHGIPTYVTKCQMYTMYTYWKFINSKIWYLLQSNLKTSICGSHSHTKCNSCEWEPSLEWSLTTLVVHSRGFLSFENPKCLVGFENALISGIWEYWNYWILKNQLKR